MITPQVGSPLNVAIAAAAAKDMNTAEAKGSKLTTKPREQRK